MDGEVDGGRSCLVAERGLAQRESAICLSDGTVASQRRRTGDIVSTQLVSLITCSNRGSAS